MAINNLQKVTLLIESGKVKTNLAGSYLKNGEKFNLFGVFCEFYRSDHPEATWTRIDDNRNSKSEDDYFYFDLGGNNLTRFLLPPQVAAFYGLQLNEIEEVNRLAGMRVDVEDNEFAERVRQYRIAAFFRGILFERQNSKQ